MRASSILEARKLKYTSWTSFRLPSIMDSKMDT